MFTSGSWLEVGARLCGALLHFSTYLRRSLASLSRSVAVVSDRIYRRFLKVGYAGYIMSSQHQLAEASSEGGRVLNP